MESSKGPIFCHEDIGEHLSASWNIKLYVLMWAWVGWDYEQKFLSFQGRMIGCAILLQGLGGLTFHFCLSHEVICALIQMHFCIHQQMFLLGNNIQELPA